MIKITIEEKHSEPRVFKAEKFPVSIGRTRDNEIRVPTPYFSREHCRIEHTGKGYKVIDLDSKNGIRVNGQTVKSSSIVSGDIISIGNTKFTFIDTDAEEPVQKTEEPPQQTETGPADGTKATLDLQKSTFNEARWNEQLEQESIAECSHCGAFFSKTARVPGIGLFCPKCKTTLSES